MTPIKFMSVNSMEKYQNILLVLVSVIVGTLLMLGCLYLYYRMLPPAVVKPRVLVSQNDRLYDLRGGYTGTFRRSIHNGGDLINWSTSIDGIRGAIRVDQPEMRIGVYGDSNIQAVFSVDTDMFTRQLEAFVRRKHGVDVEAYNAGVNGYGPDQALKKFLAQYDDLKPDVVILNVFSDNDFGDLIRNHLFVLDDQNRVIDSVNNQPLKILVNPVVYERTFSSFLEKMGKQLKLKFNEMSKSVIHNTHATHWFPPLTLYLKRELDSNVDLNRSEYLKYMRGVRNQTLSDQYDYDLSFYPKSESAQLKLKLMEAVLIQFHNEAVKRGVTFIVMIQPSSRDITTNLIKNYEFFETQFPEYDRYFLTSSVKKMCIRNGIKYVNLIDNFEHVAAHKLYFKLVDDHWTNEGQRVAAEVVGEFLVR